jgi:hypothetical protein
MRKLVMVSGSSKVHEFPQEPILALERFAGPATGVVARYFKNNQLQNIDVLILSPTYGLIDANQKIRYRPPAKKERGWHNLQLDEKDLDKMRGSNLAKLKKKFAENQYDEIYINVGKELLPMVRGVKNVVPKTVKITCAEGAGFGFKMAHMKDWFESNARSK